MRPQIFGAGTWENVVSFLQDRLIEVYHQEQILVVKTSSYLFGKAKVIIHQGGEIQKFFFLELRHMYNIIHLTSFEVALLGSLSAQIAALIVFYLSATWSGFSGFSQLKSDVGTWFFFVLFEISPLCLLVTISSFEDGSQYYFIVIYIIGELSKICLLN